MTETIIVDSTDGVKVALYHFGGTGPSLIICHATGFHARAYEPLAREIEDHFDVWALDMRGHGSSTQPDNGDFAWLGMADDLCSCVDRIGLTSVLAVGHSMGGAAILLAELARPGTFPRVYLYEPIVLPVSHSGDDSGKHKVMGAAARRRREVFESRAHALRRYASRPPLNVLRSDVLYQYVEYGFSDQGESTVGLSCRAESEARIFETTHKVSYDDVAELNTAALVGVGCTDPASGPASFASGLVRTLGQAELVRYANLGHFGPLQDPVRIAGDVKAYLG